MSSSDVQQADADLWLAYGVQLKSTIAQSSKLGPNDRFYVAPLSSVGIAAGKSINEAIMNNGVYAVGDALLDLDQPVFLPSRQSYFQRCLSYCGSIDLKSDKSAGAALRYKQKQDAQKKAQNDFQDVKAAAMKAYKEAQSNGLTTAEFNAWVVDNYPSIAQAQERNNAAVAESAAEAAAMSGSKASMVGKYLSALTSADGLNQIAGLNMLCSPSSADQVSDGRDAKTNGAYLRPLYEIEASYAQMVDDWIAMYAQNKSNAKELFAFRTSDSKKGSWGDLGFSNSDVKITGSACIFFTATYHENNMTVTKNISAADLASDMEIKITATDFASFNIKPGKWNPGELAGMPIVPNADPNLSKPKAFVNKAVLAYGVGMQVKLSSGASTTINNYLQKARSTGGSASILGFNIGLGGSTDSTQTSTVTFDQVNEASTGTAITIPPADNAYPTLLAVFGQAVPLPETK